MNADDWKRTIHSRTAPCRKQAAEHGKESLFVSCNRYFAIYRPCCQRSTETSVGSVYSSGRCKKGKFEYIDELITRINEYNEILALWIKMRQGVLSLNIENFPLKELFDIIAKGRRSFEMKHQELVVSSTNAIVKADKALTLFMINTLAENARKYTPEHGKIELSAVETDDYVEISVSDNGPGLSEEDVNRILGEKYTIQVR